MHPKAVCVSTVNQKGIPEARFVALKEVAKEGFVFCSAFNSPKGISISKNSNVALTFWWDHIERQVRVGGTAIPISDEDADRYFSERQRDAQLTTLVSEQSAFLENQEKLHEKLEEAKKRFEGKNIPRPSSWGGYCVKPSSIEFLEFKATRLHTRTLYTYSIESWSRQLLQP